MSAVLFMPESWAAMRLGILTWAHAALEAQTPSVIVVWGRQNAPAPPKPYVWLQLVVPPVTPSPADQGIDLDGMVLAIDAVIDDTVYSVTIDETLVEFTSGSLTTITLIRSGLIAAIVAASLDGVTAEALQDTVWVRGFDTIDTEDPDVSHIKLQTARSIENEGTATFQVDVIGRNVLEPPESLAISERLKASLGFERFREILTAAGWSVIEATADRKPDAVNGAQWEDRSGFDLRLRCRVRFIGFEDWIEDAIVGTAITGVLTS